MSGSSHDPAPEALIQDKSRLEFDIARLQHHINFLNTGFNEAIRQRDEFANLLFATQAELQNLRNHQIRRRPPPPTQPKRSHENKQIQNGAISRLPRRVYYSSIGKTPEVRVPTSRSKSPPNVLSATRNAAVSPPKTSDVSSPIIKEEKE